MTIKRVETLNNEKTSLLDKISYLENEHGYLVKNFEFLEI